MRVASVGDRDSWIDAAIAAGWTAVLLVEVAVESPPRLAASAVAAAVMGVALFWRRRAPLASYAVGGGALAVQATFFLVSGLYPYANLFHIYAVGVHAERRRAWVALPLAAAGVLAYFRAAEYVFAPLPGVVLVMWWLTWAAGYGVARRRDEAEARRVQAAEAAVVEERARIARDLHDLLGHSVNVMLVQAGAARRLLRHDPDRAVESLTAAEEVGREALGELDRMLGLLRAEQRDEDRTPPGLAGLPALAERLRVAGLAVEHEVTDNGSGPLPPDLDVSVYRILQEALTNALKHSRAGRARVHVDVGPAGVEVAVEDDGRGDPSHPPRPGRGLVGMRERAEAVGGWLRHGPRPEGGYRVEAWLPRR